MSPTASAGGTTLAVSHVGLCVSDLERSLRFYTEGLGFETAEGWDIRGPLARLAEVDGDMLCRSQMIVKGPAKLELLGWTSPPAEGDALTRRNQIGFTHLSVHVEDLPSVAERLVALGGTLLESTRLRIPMPDGPMDVLFVADPDGVRVELIEQHAAAAAAEEGP